MTLRRLVRPRRGTMIDAAPGGSFLQRRMQTAAAPEREILVLRRRRKVAKCLACVAGAAAFFGLYVLSWMLVL